MKTWIIYEHLFPNGKRYIGITSKRPNQRWENGSGYTETHQSAMYRAIQKYGWDNIQHNILFENLSEEEAKQKEVELIEKFHTFIHDTPCCGYNMTKGGEGSLGHVAGENVKRINRQRLNGKKGKDCCNSRPVICDGLEFASLTEFKEFYNHPKGNICGWLNGKVGMPQEWYDKGLHYKDSSMEDIKLSSAKWSNQCFIDGLSFQSQAKLAKYLGVSSAIVCLWSKNQANPPEEYIERGLAFEDDSFKLQPQTHSFKRSVFYDNQEFSSQRELAKFLGVKPATLSTWLLGKSKIPEQYYEKGLRPYK